jgi:hypothetical protein
MNEISDFWRVGWPTQESYNHGPVHDQRGMLYTNKWYTDIKETVESNFDSRGAKNAIWWEQTKMLKWKRIS